MTQGFLQFFHVTGPSVSVKPGQDQTVSDMRTPELWREELRNIRSARGRSQKSQIPASEQDEEGL